MNANDGRLTLRLGEGTASFELGRRAELWAKKIRAPKGLLDKLGIRPEHAVTALSIDDAQFIAALRAHARDVATDRRRKSRDVVLFGAERAEDLAALGSVEGLLQREGAVWIVYPKGQKRITEADVLAAGRAAGLVDVKVARFSDSHTALKFVIPRVRR